MRFLTFGMITMMIALFLALQNCGGKSSGDRDSAGGENFPESFPQSWDGRTDYAGSPLSIQ